MPTLGHFLVVGFGAACGAVLRWRLGLWLNNSAAAIPWGTLAANLVGAYLVGVLLAFISLHPEVPEWLKLALATGFLGGLTTFSAFSAETVGMLLRGNYWMAALYAGGSLLGSLALTILGFMSVQGLR